MSAPYVLSRIAELVGLDTVFTTGPGPHAALAAELIDHGSARGWVSGASAARGFAVLAAMRAKLAAPHRPVWAIDDRPGFQMMN